MLQMAFKIHYAFKLRELCIPTQYQNRVYCCHIRMYSFSDLEQTSPKCVYRPSALNLLNYPVFGDLFRFY